ncbi:prepilin peptidase [Desulfoscipio gibsoniae]
MIPWLAVFLITLKCAIDDYRELKIYDIYTLPAIASGFIFHVFSGDLQNSVTGMALGLAVGFTGTLFGGGGGDAKLITAIGAWFGAYDLILILIIALLVAMTWFSVMFIQSFVTGKEMPKVIPFGVCLFIGLSIILFSGWRYLWTISEIGLSEWPHIVTAKLFHQP